ncbi:MAG: cellulase family glycosylhydrolase [Armatimonadota bacterium]
MATRVGHSAAAEPLRLHPDNPHYFLFRGEPTVIIGSGEHYGAVLNLDFDYVKYLDTLRRDGMNHTRLFVGPYCEADTSFNIVRNTLAPAAGRFACPWARSDVPGYANGGNKFDLTRWDEAFFARLRDFVAQAGERGVIVEVNLFCPYYGEPMWALSPFNPNNNVNDLGPVERTEVFRLDGHAGLLAIQEQMVRKVVAELAEFDNLYYEIMNEPYAREVPADWQRHIAAAIADAQSDGPRHLISQNIANHQAQVTDPDPNVSILNFHYAWPPTTVGLNYALGRAIGDNETGFKGTAGFPYRREAWAFMIAGGGLFSHLDYSFTVGHEDGSFELPEKQPGGGGPSLRRQLRVLADFLRGFDFVRMAPLPEAITGDLPQGLHAFVLAEAGRQYAVYLCHEEPRPNAVSAELLLELPAGTYTLAWLNTLTGETEGGERLEHEGGALRLVSPPFPEDLALEVMGA